jgi:hypothetical protein
VRICEFEDRKKECKIWREKIEILVKMENMWKINLWESMNSSDLGS